MQMGERAYIYALQLGSDLLDAPAHVGQRARLHGQVVRLALHLQLLLLPDVRRQDLLAVVQVALRADRGQLGFKTLYLGMRPYHNEHLANLYWQGIQHR